MRASVEGWPPRKVIVTDGPTHWEFHPDGDLITGPIGQDPTNARATAERALTMLTERAEAVRRHTMRMTGEKDD